MSSAIFLKTDSVNIFCHHFWQGRLKVSLAGNDSLMQIQIRQENRRLLGNPYSSCEDPEKTLLNHYGIYERQNCISG